MAVRSHSLSCNRVVIASINPATGETLRRFDELTDAQLEEMLANVGVLVETIEKERLLDVWFLGRGWKWRLLGKRVAPNTARSAATAESTTGVKRTGSQPQARLVPALQ